MAAPKLNRKMLRAVGIELARGAAVSTFEDRIARRFRCTDRAVRKYAAIINEQRDAEDALDLRRARRRGRFVADAACAKHLERADRLYAEASKLLMRARRIDGGKSAAGDRLVAAIEAAGRRVLDDDGGMDEPADHEGEANRARGVLAIARADRFDAAILIKRGEAADALAQGWFDKSQKIAGTYDPQPGGGETRSGGAGANLTSAQKRAALAKLRDAIAKRTKGP